MNTSTDQHSVFSPELSDPLSHPETFADPPNEVRPKWRWWWTGSYFSTEEARREMEAMIDAGFSGAEITWDGGLWANAEQREALQATLELAGERDFEIDMTLAPSWPISSPATASETGLSQLELQYGRIDIQGKSAFIGPVPNPVDDSTNERRADLVAVTAARVLDRGPAVEPPESDEGPGSPPSAGNMHPPERSTTLDTSSLLDLTTEISDGEVRWTAPAGDWIVFGFWSRPTLQGGGNGLSLCDADSVRATVDYVEENQIGPANLKLLRDTGGSFFEDSLEYSAQSLFWARRLLAEFSDRRGYELTPYLPLLFVQGVSRYWVPGSEPVSDFSLSEKDDERIRADYRTLLDDLYIEEHVGVLAHWASSHGMRLRTQPAYGQNLNVTRAARETVRAGGRVDDETLNAGGWGDPPTETPPYDTQSTHWRFALDHYRSVVSGSHQGGENEIASELGATGRVYGLTLTDYKTLMDNQWAAGITRPILHGFNFQAPSSSWPGTAKFSVSETWNDRTYPQWSMLRPLANYWSRGALVLQAGTARADVAVLYDGFVTTAGRTRGDRDTPPEPLFDALSMEERGYRVQYIDSVGLADPQAVGDGVLYPNGPRYRALVIHQETVPPETAEAMAELAERGLRIVFVGDPPSRAATFAEPETANKRVTCAVAQMLAAPSVSRVDEAAEVGPALRQLGLRSDVSWDDPAQLYTQHRETEGSDYYYLYNPTTEPISLDAVFEATGAPWRMDLWTGDIASVAVYRAGSDTVTVPLALEPGQNVVLGFARDQSATATHIVGSDVESVVVTPDGSFELRDRGSGPRDVTVSTGAHIGVSLPTLREPVVPRSWRLEVVEESPEPKPIRHELELTGLPDWRDVDELDNASGTGTYTTSVLLPPSWTAPERGTYLELGQVDGGSVQVKVNDRLAHPSPVTEQPVDVSDLLVEGCNTITVTFASTLLNRIGFMGRSQAYGLRGPVQLVPYSRAVLVLTSETGFVVVPSDAALIAAQDGVGHPGLAPRAT